MVMSNRPAEAAFSTGAINARTQHTAKASDSIHAALAKIMRATPHHDEQATPKLSFRQKLLRFLKSVSHKLHQVNSRTPKPTPAATETYQTEGTVFNLLSHIPVIDLVMQDEDEKDDDEGDERQPRRAMDLGTHVEMIEEFRKATMHTTAVDLPCDIWHATVLRSKRWY